MSSEIVKNVNPDLVLERKKCTFDVEELAKWWNGGEQELLKKHEMGLCVSFKKSVCENKIIFVKNLAKTNK